MPVSARLRPLACLLLLAIGAGCVSSGAKVGSHAEWLAETTRTYPGEAPERVIAAAETILKHSDPADVSFDYSLGGFVANRKFFVYAVLAAADGEDRWSFRASKSGEGVRASVSLVERMRVRSSAGTDSARTNQKHVGTFKLFYARLDYMLGRRPDWVGCRDAPRALGLPADQPGTEGLCGFTHGGKDSEPPRPLSAAAKSRSSSKVAAAGETSADAPEE